ncbi:hypothetical protein CO154_00860 [Candidatus Pacearchaeota archaeon CG_4_9_14_3_um_filter_31_7]|nr:MAG: hypothetical protein AUJ10_02825 [Candidatus Pacearchaeota archaeon CG1_02_31_27]PIN92093.1 MAG: hypothetical protein COU55_02815 [Candidatus Pacearchaeota archaeon CG10_big_fil_rev_8_21_14_0_10_31_59]PIZ80308.1 MAG: hypothetical protein COX99_02920 [Candidatus Pacearchaeota archaeon CG_4_10_14_0_2_um_filter_31_10]PJA70824.1 MAG: hypothetical protein CO154_00860 [Candidatus Pacearchaeota archaeon CG_4_9_14_3_um_filter_31_7]
MVVKSKDAKNALREIGKRTGIDVKLVGDELVAKGRRKEAYLPVRGEHVSNEALSRFCDRLPGVTGHGDRDGYLRYFKNSGKSGARYLTEIMKKMHKPGALNETQVNQNYSTVATLIFASLTAIFSILFIITATSINAAAIGTAEQEIKFIPLIILGLTLISAVVTILMNRKARKER